MKTRNIWEVSDIVCGSYVCRESWPEDSEDIGGLCSVTYKLGYMGGGSSYCMCKVAITDGLVLDYPSTEKDILKRGNAKEVLVEALNSDIEGYRPLTDVQVARRMNYLFRVEMKNET